MTDNDLVLAVLAGQTDGYLTHPGAAAFAAAGLPNEQQVSQILSALQAGGLCVGGDDGWGITAEGRAAAPMLPDGTPEPLPEPTIPQQVLAAIDSLDPASSSIADVIAAVKTVLAEN